MIALLILNNSGDVIYQSTFSTRQQPNEANIIRLFLPLLLTKDLLKANFHDRIHYVHHRNKTIAFWEVSNQVVSMFMYMVLRMYLETWTSLSHVDEERNNPSKYATTSFTHHRSTITLPVWSTVVYQGGRSNNIIYKTIAMARIT